LDFLPTQHGTVLEILFNKVYHHTRQNIGFAQVGVAFIVKAKVASTSAKRQ
jgi:hypothetical protein